MTNLRQAAQRALKAMEDGEDRADMIEFSDALIALRAALAEPEQEQQNPRVVWAAAKPFRGILPWGQNPPDNDGTWFSFRGTDSFMWLDGAWFQMPPAPVVPWPGRQATPQPEQPLTDAEIQTIWAKTFEMGSSANTFARAIERAHGIGDSNAT